MKTILFITSFILVFNITKAQVINHPTVSDLKVMYKAQPMASTNTPGGIQSVPNATVNLVAGSNVSKINFKIVNAQTNSVIYQVSYPVNSAVVLDGQGKKLFENNNGVIFISSGQAIPLKPYSYQITTEDSQQNISAVYTAVK